MNIELIEKAKKYIELKKEIESLEKELKEVRDYILKESPSNEILVEELKQKLQIRESSVTEYNIKKIYEEMQSQKLSNQFFNIIKINKSSINTLPIDESKRNTIESIVLKHSMRLPGSKAIYIMKLKD